jgi:DNA-binding protein H-NS
MARLIELSDGYPAIVDDEDYDRARVHSWRRNAGGYVVSDVVGLMHRFIMEPPDDVRLDHVNGDGCDNRRGNLRHATLFQNQYNRAKTRTNTSGFKGVSWNAGWAKWVARVSVDGKQSLIGGYDTPQAADAAYRAAAKHLHGEFFRADPAPPEREAIFDAIIEARSEKLAAIKAKQRTLSEQASAIRDESVLAMRWKVDGMAGEQGMSLEAFAHKYLLAETADDQPRQLRRGGDIPRPRARRGVVPPKYASPEDPSVTWSGRGPYPGWFSAALDRGLSREDMEIDCHAIGLSLGEKP